MAKKYTLLILQIFSHSALVFLIFKGELHHWLICLGAYFLSGCVGMSVTYHRGLAHKSWKMPKAFEYLGLFWATVGLTGSAIAWVAVHREHHANADREEDPHSPHHKGFFSCQWLSMFIPVKLRFVPDLIKRPLYKFQHRHYLLINLLWGGLLCSIDPYLLLATHLAPAAILWNGGSLVVTLSHLWGHRPSKQRDLSTNNVFLALLTWGEGFHSNHHARPNSPRFARHWWQYDAGYYVISLVKRLSA